jgi:uridine kinase
VIRLNTDVIVKIAQNAKIFPFFIFICGGTCSGKTFLADQIKQILKEECLVISMDNYFKDRWDHTLPYFSLPSFDLPGSYRLGELRSDLQRLLLGSPIEMPIYEIKNNQRIGKKTVKPAKIIVVEGLYASHLSDIVDNLSQKLSIFITCNAELIFQRRIDRDVKLGFKTEVAVENYQHYVEPIYRMLIQNQKTDLIINNNFERSE